MYECVCGKGIERLGGWVRNSDRYLYLYLPLARPRPRLTPGPTAGTFLLHLSAPRVHKNSWSLVHSIYAPYIFSPKNDLKPKIMSDSA